MELLDIIDENNKLTGQIEDRDIIHEKGIWHRQVACWIMNKEGKLLFQKRVGDKRQNPNKWARTGGHVDSGENTISAIIREIKEEIGISVAKQDLQLLSLRQKQEYLEKEKVYHRYYGYDYITLVDYELKDYTIQNEELTNLKYISIEEMEEIREKKDENYTFTRWDDIKEQIQLLKKWKQENLKEEIKIEQKGNCRKLENEYASR